MSREILVVGTGSLTGSRFIELGQEKFKMYGAGGEMDEGLEGLAGFDKLDITDPKNVEDVVSKFPGDVVINFAGATLVDEIEKTRPQNPSDQTELEEDMAYRVNVLGTRNLAAACKKSGKFPIFISTGFVFDGKNGPYMEEDAVADSAESVSWYAWTKILAEREVKTSGIRALTLRISYPYRSEYSGKTDFARSMLRVYDEFSEGRRDSIYTFFSDQTLTPTFIDDIPDAVAVLLEKNAEGIFHLTSPEKTTPFNFGLELLKVARGVENPEKLIQKGSITDFQASHTELAKRPVHGGEKSDKIIELGFRPTGWREGIQKAYGK